jgi:hypothetical protein
VYSEPEVEVSVAVKYWRREWNVEGGRVKMWDGVEAIFRTETAVLGLLLVQLAVFDIEDKRRL